MTNKNDKGGTLNRKNGPKKPNCIETEMRRFLKIMKIRRAEKTTQRARGELCYSLKLFKLLFNQILFYWNSNKKKKIFKYNL